MARRKEYTPAAFRRAVEGYFARISRTAPVVELVPSGRYTQKGEPILEPVKVLNDAGEEITRREYLVPPSMGDLCLALGITRQTWARYAAADGYREVCEDAKLRVESWLERQLIECPKAARGIIFNLQSNFDWRERREVELGSDTREALSMQQKIELLKSLGVDTDGDEDT